MRHKGKSNGDLWESLCSHAEGSALFSTFASLFISNLDCGKDGQATPVILSNIRKDREIFFDTLKL